MVEELHFTGGEIIPSRVLCPWRAHLLASTLPAVARATAACFVRCEWMVGRGVGLLVVPSSHWCVRCSSHGPWLHHAECHDVRASSMQRKLGEADDDGNWQFGSPASASASATASRLTP